jgi:hypothetical protein
MTLRAILFAICGVVAISGCSWLHDLQPHRLWRLNRQSPPSGNSWYSVSDPIPELEQYQQSRRRHLDELNAE